MAEKMSYFGSDEWIPHLSNLGFDVLKNLQKHPGGRFLRFRDTLIGTKDNHGEIVKEYHASVDLLKKEIFGANAINSNLDHHKIAALYIRSFLIHQPFILDIPADTNNKERCLYTVLANEYFSFIYLATVFKAWNEKFDWVLDMENGYKFDFIKLLYRYKKYAKLDPYALSNIIYLIEKLFFKEKKPTWA